MSEHKRKEAIHRLADDATRLFTDKGLLVEAGFAAMLVLVYPEGLDPARQAELRDVFMAGAQHLFGSITGSLLDDGAEPTEDDLRRMDLINSELEAFTNDYAKRHGFEPPRPPPSRRQ
jgi:hypothetical protein